MATKALKSITMNSTKYELANTLGVSDGKIQLKAKDVLLSEVDAPAGGDALFFRYDEIADTVTVTNAKGETITDKASAFEILEKGGAVYAIYPGGGGDVFQAMTFSFGDASGFYVDFERAFGEGSNSVTTIHINWWGDTPTWTKKEYTGLFQIIKTGLTSLSGLAVGDPVIYNGVNYPEQQEMNNIKLQIRSIINGIYCQCISRMPQEYGTGTSGMSFIACYNSEKYIIGLKKQNDAWTIGSLKAL